MGVCSSVGELQTSVAALKAVPVVQDGVSADGDAFATVQSDVSQVVQDAQSQYATQTEALTADVTAVQTAVSQAQVDTSRATLEAVASSIGTLADDVTSLAGDVSSTC
jgi:predicted lipoprotein